MGKCGDSAGESTEDVRVNIQEFQYFLSRIFLQQKPTQNLCNNLRTCAMYGCHVILHVPVALPPEQKRRSARSLLEKNL